LKGIKQSIKINKTIKNVQDKSFQKLFLQAKAAAGEVQSSSLDSKNKHELKLK
jgi:hypothetical protein